jgi:hypothetical protein
VVEAASGTSAPRQGWGGIETDLQRGARDCLWTQIYGALKGALRALKKKHCEFKREVRTACSAYGDWRRMLQNRAVQSYIL